MILVPGASLDLLGVGEVGVDEASDGKGELLWIVEAVDVGLAVVIGPVVDGALQPTTSRLSMRTRRHMRQVCGSEGLYSLIERLRLGAGWRAVRHARIGSEPAPWTARG
jgi:hypothetical protein